MAVALIVAAGRGERLGSGRPKALVTLAGRPMLEWSVAALRAVSAVERIVVALPGRRARRRPRRDGRGRRRRSPLAVGARRAGGVRRRGPGDRPRRRAPAGRPGRCSSARSTSSRARGRRGDRRRAGDRHGQGGRRRRQTVQRHARSRAACGRSRRPRCSAATRSSGRWPTPPRRCWPRATDDAWLIEQRGRVGADRARRRLEPQGDHPDRPAARRAAAGGAVSVPTPGSATTATGSRTGAGSILGGSSSRPPDAAWPATRTPTCSPTRSSTRCSARPRLGDIGHALPGHRRALPRCRLARAAARGGRDARRAGIHRGQRRRHRGDRAPEAGPAARADPRQRSPRRSGSRRDHVSVKATRGEGMGFVGREEGAAALAVATVAPAGD